MPEQEFGILSVRAYTASSALPVSGALVKISGAEESNADIFYSLITDRDGVTEEVSLPAPQRSLSLAPGAIEVPYSVYDLEVSAPGYYSKRIYGLTIFPGIRSMQLINMIPLSEDGEESYPEGNLDTVIPPNEI